MNKKLIIAPYTLMHYESKLDTYFFYNTKDDNFWETDEVTGSIVSILDGTNSCEDIVSMLHESSPDISIEDLQEHFGKTFDFLLKEGYILEYTGKKPSYDYKPEKVTFDLDKKSVAADNHKDISDEDYDKYIRYFLDSILDPSKMNKKFEFNHDHRQMKQHIVEYSGDENYLFSAPLAVAWNLTNACNFRCIHCLYNEKEYSSKGDLTTEQALNLADELIEAGVVSVALSGGEAFLRPDTMDIIRKFKENNVAVHIFTNGSLLTDEIIDELAELFNPFTDEVKISFDAATDETFRKIRRSDKFDFINQNIKKLTDKGVVVINGCTANGINKDEIFDIYKLSKSLGAKSFAISPMENFNGSHVKLNIETRELFKMYYDLSENEDFDNSCLPIFWKPHQLLNIPEVLKILNEPHYQKLLNEECTKPLLKCDCQSHNLVSVGSDGRISLCTDTLFYNIGILGNYKDNSFAEIWEKRWDNPLFQPRNREKSECGNCKFNKWCIGGCKVSAYIKSKNVNEPAIPNCLACH